MSVGESKTYFRGDTEVREVSLGLSRPIVMYLAMMFSEGAAHCSRERSCWYRSLYVLLCCVLTFFLQLKCLFEWILPGGLLSFMMKCCVKYYPHHLGREEHKTQSRWVWWSGYCAWSVCELHMLHSRGFRTTIGILSQKAKWYGENA